MFEGRHAWLTPERLRLYPAALVFAVAVAVTLSVLAADGSRTLSGRLGGDFPAFFGAGRLLADGRVEDLYRWEAQRDAQIGLLLPEQAGEFLAFAYPPFVALPYALLVPLGYAGAYAVHTLAMAALLGCAVLALRPLLPRVDRYPLAAFALALALPPLMRAVTSGQNTALTLALIAWTGRLLYERRFTLAGVPLGLLLFKPQLGLPLIGLVLLTRQLAVLPTMLLTAAALWTAGAVLGGVGWVGWWWSQIGRFHTLDQDVNAPNSVGLLGVAEAWFGPGSPLAFAFAVPLVLLLVLALMARWWRQRDDLDARLAVTAPALALIPPHAMHYDSGLVALSWLVLADRWGRAAVAPLGLLYLGSLLGEARGLLGWNPMVGVVAATLALAWTLPARRAGR